MAGAVVGGRLNSESSERRSHGHTWMDGWDWLWMTLTMGFWLVFLGAVIYIAVRLAQRPPTRPRTDS